MNYHFADLIGRSRWLIEPSAMKRLIVAAAEATPEAIEARRAAAAQLSATPEMAGDIAIINISGPISYRPSLFSWYFGGATVERMQAQFRTALNDPAVKAIVFRVDSPGGTVDGVPEFAAEILKARGQKPIVSVSDTLNASAALWISSQADQLLVAPSSQTGSIGVWMAHEDDSKWLDTLGIKITLIFAGDHKVDGNPFEALPDDVRARWQEEVNAVHADFIAAVARGRGASAADVRKSYGQGLCYTAKDAVKLGIADKIATFETALVLAPKASSKGRRAEGENIVPLATLAEIAGVAGSTATITIDGAALASRREKETTAGAAPIAEESVSTPAEDAAQLAADRDYTDLGVRIAERL